VEHYKGRKGRGSHTTYIDTNFGKKLVRDADRIATVTGIVFCFISKTSGRPKAKYSAKIIRVGLEVTILGSSHKQPIILHTTCPEQVARQLKIRFKDRK
jgi:hypothetical protein